MDIFETVRQEAGKRFGEGATFPASGSQHLQVDAIPTGSIGLNKAIRIGGIPRGRVTEIYGHESSGKTTICLHIVAEAQKLGLAPGYVDMEHALDAVYMQALGIDLDRLEVAQPGSGEEALEIAEIMIRSGMSLVIVDSVSALVPKSELEGKMGDATMGMQARLMSQACRKLNSLLKEKNAALIFTNQMRQKIGVLFGNPEVTSGGMALKFYASVRLDVRKKIKKDEGLAIGNTTTVSVVKNKVAAPFGAAEFDVIFGKGIWRPAEILDLGEKAEIVTKRGAFYSYNDLRLGQGRDNSVEFLAQNPALMAEIEEKLK